MIKKVILATLGFTMLALPLVASADTLATPAISVSVSANRVRQLQNFYISWNSSLGTSNPPASAAVKLSLYTVEAIADSTGVSAYTYSLANTGYANGIMPAGSLWGDIATGLATSSSYAWTVPDRLSCGNGLYAPGPRGCGGVGGSSMIYNALNPGKYVVVASMYTPANAEAVTWTTGNSNLPNPSYLAFATSSIFTINASSTASFQSWPIGGGCFIITHNLSFGSTDATTGSDVTTLQNFLISTGNLPSGDNTGFFGSATLAAVRNWQSAQNIAYAGGQNATGYGLVGPRTRSAISGFCSSNGGSSTGGSTTSSTSGSQNFAVSSNSGAAPYTVTFTAVASTSVTQAGGSYAVDFGDGTAGQMSEDSSNNLSASHTYTQGGTFNARFLQEQSICGAASSAFSYNCMTQLQIGSAIVTVTGGSTIAAPVTNTSGTGGSTTAAFSNSAFNFSPVCGIGPFTVTFSNVSGAIDFGDGTGMAASSGTVTHTYLYAGTYMATTNNMGLLVEVSLPTGNQTVLSNGQINCSSVSQSYAVPPGQSQDPLNNRWGHK